MKDNFPTEETIRQYLLGRLDDQEGLEHRLSEQMLFDDELSEIVDSIEDEIIEDYLDGAVAPADRAAIEEYFLRPVERRQKVQLSRLLRHHFEMHPPLLSKKKPDARPELVPNLDSDSCSLLPVPASHRSFNSRIFLGLAAALLFVVGLLYAFAVSHRLRSELEASRKSQEQLKDQLTHERERSKGLENQLDVASTVVLQFWKGFRGPGNVSKQTADIKPWTKRVRVDIDLGDKVSGNYDVQLDRSGQTVWSQAGIPVSRGELRFELPTGRISAGEYCLRVSSQPKPYCFQAKVSKT